LLLFWISRIGRRFRDAVFLALAVPFVGLGYTYALQDHQFFANYSLVQQQHLQDLLAQAPGLSPGSFVVFRDHARAFVDPYVFYYGYYFDAAAKQLYGDPSISVIVCPLASDLLQTTCTFEAGGLHVTRGENDVKSDVTVPYNRVMFVENDVDDHFRLLSPEELSTAHDVPGYNPQALILQTPPPPRAATLFSCAPAMSCYRDAQPPASAFDLPSTGPIGRGWRLPEPDAGGGTHRWALTNTPMINLGLTTDADLTLEFHISEWSAPDVIDSLTLSLNGAAIPLTYEAAQPGRLYRGVLTRDVLKRSTTNTEQLVFHLDRLAPLPAAPDVPVGFALTSLRVRPR